MRIPVTKDLSLTIGDKPADRTRYPTSRLAKGLVLRCRGLDLAEEAVGFGVPVLMRGVQALFPGEVELHLRRGSPKWALTARYIVNLVERLGGPGKKSLEGGLLYAAKNSLSALRARFPPSRAPLMTLSSSLRWLFGWETTFEKAGFSGPIQMTYLFDERTGLLSIEADLSGLPRGTFSEVFLMNEQGAHYFDQYSDSSGAYLSGKQVGCWDEVRAQEAGFSSPSQRVAFRVHQVPGARLFRGRELVGSRLAWAGFGYSFPPSIQKLRYDLKITRLP